MKYRNVFTKSLVMIAFVGIVMAGAGVWLTTYVRAFNPQPDPPAFGPVSVNPGQTLRLNVVNRLSPPPEPDRLGRSTRHAMLAFDMYRADVPPGPCATAHRFADRQSCEVTLAPGEAASFDLTSAAEIGLTQVLPAVQDDDRNQSPALVYTLEVRENGKTILLLPAVQRSNTWAGSN